MTLLVVELNVGQLLRVSGKEKKIYKKLSCFIVAPRKSAPLRREPSMSARPVQKEAPVRPVQSAMPSAAPQPQQQANVNTVQLAALTKTITELKLSVDEMEKERDFYFNKLRDIEILTQKVTDPTITQSPFFKQVTEILYTTEEGFEIPAESMEAAGVKAN